MIFLAFYNCCKMNKVYDKNIFLSNRDDDEIIYWEDE
jgi:hypothetical protein